MNKFEEPSPRGLTGSEWQRRWWLARKVYDEEKASDALTWRKLSRQQKNRWYEVAVELEHHE